MKNETEKNWAIGLTCELETIVELHRGVGDRVVLESHQVQMQDGGQLFEEDSLLGILQTQSAFFAKF